MKPDCRNDHGEFFKRGIHSYPCKDDAVRASHWIASGTVVVEVTVEPEDIVAVGELWYDNCREQFHYDRTEIVATKITISKEEFDRAMKEHQG